MLSPSSLSPHMRCLAMEEASPTKLSRSSSFPSRPPVVLKSPSSVTRPYASAIRPPSKLPPDGSMASSIKPSSLLQRRSKAGHGFSVSAVNTGTAVTDPAPACSNPATAYEVLQIPPSASQQEIKTAFWRLARQHHPDKVSFEQKDASSIAFLQIHSAYVALKDPESRARYDAQMSMDSSGYKQKFSGISVDVKTPFTYRPHPNIFTPMGATPAASTTSYYTPRTQVFMPSGVALSTPRSYPYTPKTPSAGGSPNFYAPRSPYTTGRSWETDQCW